MTLLSRFLPSLTFHLFPLARLLIVDEWSRWASQVALVVNNQSASAGDTGDEGLLPGSGKIPWRRKWPPMELPGKFHGQKEPCGLQPMRSQSQT